MASNINKIATTIATKHTHALTVATTKQYIETAVSLLQYYLI